MKLKIWMPNKKEELSTDFGTEVVHKFQDKEIEDSGDMFLAIYYDSGKIIVDVYEEKLDCETLVETLRINPFI